jgi:type IX secretion system PorP/SprF family membrane protein
MFRLIITIVGVLLLSVPTQAQQRFRRTSFPVNSFVVNPAVAGTEAYTVFGSSYRNQWAGFEGAPTTTLITAHTSFAKSLGGGLLIYKDDMGGAVTQTGFELTGSYQIRLPNSDGVSFGLSLQGTQFGFDSRDLEVWDQDDPALSGGMETTFGVDAAAGFLVYGDDYSMGIAVSNLFQDELGLTAVDSAMNQSVRHYRFMGSYTYDISKILAIQSSGMVRMTEVTPPQFDVYSRAIYSHRKYGSKYWSGLGYRVGDALSFSLGMLYANVGVSYSYDFTTSGNLLGRHSHEINLNYLLPNRRGGKGYRRVLDRGRLVK